MTSSPVGRPRTAGRLDLPDNLNPRVRRGVTYWYWRDPRDGREHSLRCPGDRKLAIARARELNALVARDRADTVVSGILSSAPKRAAGVPFSTYAAHCLVLWESRGLAPNTMKTRRSLVRAAITGLGDSLLHEVSVADVATVLATYTAQGKNRMAQSLRAVLIDIWRDAKEEGLIPAEAASPAEVARRPTAKVQRARLTLEAFEAILAAAEGMAKTRGAWIRNSMLLALVTAQRREDLAIAQFRRGRDWQPAWLALQLREDHPAHPYPHVHEGDFWVAQQKTGALVRIPLDLRLDALALTVGDVIDQCRSSTVAKHLLHHTKPFGNAPAGSRISIDRISHAFAEARDKTGLGWPGKTPPTYHEIRSLAERLYRAQGIDTQALLGHRHARMTEVYADPRQAEWLKVR